MTGDQLGISYLGDKYVYKGGSFYGMYAHV